MRRAVAHVRDDVMYAGGPDAPGEDATDEEWLPVAGDNGWVVIHRDKKIRKRDAQRSALLEAGVRTFCMTSAGNYTRWTTLSLLCRRWPDIEREATATAGPYIVSVTWDGLRTLYVPGAG